MISRAVATLPLPGGTPTEMHELHERKNAQISSRWKILTRTYGNIVTGEELVARERERKKLTPEQALLLSNDPRIWRPL